MSAPEGEPSESFILKENDFLYFPRGHWHAPEPCGSHSLHISFAFRRRNGIDFMKYLLPQLASQIAFRLDIDKTGNELTNHDYVSGLLLALEDIVSVENLESFIGFCGSRKFITDAVRFENIILNDK